jgi:cytochrome P450
MTNASSLYRPPAPVPLSPLVSLLRVLTSQPRSLLGLVPKEAYTEMVTPLGYSRRGILLVNDPEITRTILTNPLEHFPKNDLMVGALEPLVGESIFVSDGAAWRRQRQMVEPAFSHMGIARAFRWMREAVDDYEAHLDGVAARGETFSLDAAMSHLTADIICRTIFSKSLEIGTARDVFTSFAEFERSVASVDLYQLIVGKPWSKVRQPDHVLSACERIRAHIDALLAPALEAEAPKAGGGILEHAGGDRLAEARGDIVADLVAARDATTGEGFTRKELIDQIGVFFLAGHETTASVMTWAFFILSQRPEVVERMRAEIDAVVGSGEVELAHVKKLEFTRDVFREALRLYPPITFIPRVAAEDTQIGRYRAKKGTMIMIAPWTTHRHHALWPHPDRFDPDRFMRDEIIPGSYMPVGLGPRICVGAAFATIESGLMLARLVRRYDFEAIAPDAVKPVARLTTRPASEIMMRVRRRG